MKQLENSWREPTCHPRAACRRRSTSAGPEGCPPCLGSLPSHSRLCRKARPRNKTILNHSLSVYSKNIISNLHILYVVCQNPILAFKNQNLSTSEIHTTEFTSRVMVLPVRVFTKICMMINQQPLKYLSKDEKAEQDVPHQFIGRGLKAT